MELKEDYDNLIFKTDDTVYFGAEVDDESISHMIKILEPLFKEFRDDLDSRSFYTDSEEKITAMFPYKIVIFSPGGLVSAGLRLIDFIEEQKEHDVFDIIVHTHASSGIGSMGSIIFLAGDIRSMDKRGTIHFHELSGGHFGKMRDLDGQYQHSKALYTTILNFIVERTGLTIEEADALNGTDVWVNKEEAIKKRIVSDESKFTPDEADSMDNLIELLPESAKEYLYLKLEETYGVSPN
jgi:ATP-dependent protease ClpP protease subunit